MGIEALTDTPRGVGPNGGPKVEQCGRLPQRPAVIGAMDPLYFSHNSHHPLHRVGPTPRRNTQHRMGPANYGTRRYSLRDVTSCRPLEFFGGKLIREIPNFRELIRAAQMEIKYLDGSAILGLT
jgi:hypothetical protein